MKKEKLKVVKLNPILKFRIGLWDKFKGQGIDGYETIFVSCFKL